MKYKPDPISRDQIIRYLNLSDIRVQVSLVDFLVTLTWPELTVIVDQIKLRLRCEICGNPIEVMAFKGTGVCSDLHRKLRNGDDRNDGRY